ncbi:MAG: hypothetical protein WA435_11150 [Gallionellaceae bacterium]
MENLIDDACSENALGLLMWLNTLIEFGDAFGHTGADFREWWAKRDSGASNSSVWPPRGAQPLPARTHFTHDGKEKTRLNPKFMAGNPIRLNGD